MANATMNRAQPTEFRSIKREGRQADGLLCSFIVCLSVPSAAGEKQMNGEMKKKK